MSPILLVLAHPDSSSLNHALAEAVRRALEERGHTVEGRWLHLPAVGQWLLAVGCSPSSKASPEAKKPLQQTSGSN